MNKKDKSSIKKKEGESTFGKNNVFLAILIIILAIVAIVGIVTLNNNNETPLTNTTNNTVNVTNISTVNNSSDIVPKEGYSLVRLGGLKFFAPDDYLGNYRSGEYLDAFKGGKDYEEILKIPEGDMEREIAINSSQLIFVPYSNGKSSNVEIRFNYGYDNEESENLGESNLKDITTETRNINGNNVKVIKTGKNFIDQTRGPNETYVQFIINNKSVVIEFTGVPIDEYLIESFFRLN